MHCNLDYFILKISRGKLGGYAYNIHAQINK